MDTCVYLTCLQFSFNRCIWCLWMIIHIICWQLSTGCGFYVDTRQRPKSLAYILLCLHDPWYYEWFVSIEIKLEWNHYQWNHYFTRYSLIKKVTHLMQFISDINLNELKHDLLRLRRAIPLKIGLFLSTAIKNWLKVNMFEKDLLLNGLAL